MPDNDDLVVWTKRGSRQGCPLGGIAFNQMYEQVLRKIRTAGEKHGIWNEIMWWNGSGIRRRAVEASRTHLKSSRSDPSFARGLRRSFNRSKSVGSHRSSSNTSASVVFGAPRDTNLCKCAFARCEAALWRREWCTAKSQHQISGAKYTRN